ncbi:hypothetical protein T439DRAFT_324833 [Meredithblackwellia eburnea MCA 4105]
MSSSLSTACNSAKQEYDTCFNHWFKSYLLLVAPPFNNPDPTSSDGAREREQRQKQIDEKKKEYDLKCGGFYQSYTACLKKSIPEREGLADLLATARKEEPLSGWGGIKVVTEEDLKE